MVKNLPSNAGEVGSITGLERAPGEGNGNPFQYSCLENSMDRGAGRVTVHGVTKSQTHTLSSTKEARIYNGKKIASLTSGAGKIGQPLVKE